MNFAQRQNSGTISEIWAMHLKGELHLRRTVQSNFQNDAIRSLSDWMESFPASFDWLIAWSYSEWKPDSGLTIAVDRTLTIKPWSVVSNCILADEAMMSSESECIFSWTDIVRWITRIRIWPVIIAVTWEVEFWFWIRMFIIIQTAKFCFRTQFWNVEFLAFNNTIPMQNLFLKLKKSSRIATLA